MTKKQKAISYLEKQREICIQMRADMKNYMRPNEKGYVKIRNGYTEQINIIDYILLRIR